MARTFQAKLLSKTTKKVKETKTITTRNQGVLSDVKRQLGISGDRTVVTQYIHNGFKFSTHHSTDYWMVIEQVPQRLARFT